MNTATHYIDINSSFRQINPNFNLESASNLVNSQINFNYNLATISFEQKINLDVGDFVFINNVSLDKNLTAYTFTLNSKYIKSIPNSNIIQIFYDHTLNDNFSYYVKISNSLLDNLPNKKYKIFLYLDPIKYSYLNLDPSFFVNNKKFFFILIDNKLDNCSSNTEDMSHMPLCDNYNIVSDYNIDFTIENSFNFYDIINDLPVKVSEVSKNYFTFKINYPYNYSITANIDFTISKIINYTPGFPSSNQYEIQLNPPLDNVVSLKIISSEFPNLNYIFLNKSLKSDSFGKISLDWKNNIDDEIFSLLIPSDFFSWNAQDILIFLQKNINLIERPQKTSNHIPIHYFDITFNSFNNGLIFNSYLKFFIRNGIVKYDKFNHLIYINDNNHIMEKNDQIIIYNSFTQNYLSGIYFIKDILDENNYVVEINSNDIIFLINNDNVFNYLDLSIYKKDKFMFVKDTENNTILKEKFINFNSYNKYSESNEIIINSDIIHYIVMKIENFDFMQTNANYGNAFTKILFIDSPQKNITNTFIPVNYVLKNPLNIKNLKISFFYPDNTPFDFGDLNHSFTLEIITIV